MKNAAEVSRGVERVEKRRRRDDETEAREDDKAVEEMRDDTLLNTHSVALSCTAGSRWLRVALHVGGNRVGCLSSESLSGV